MPLKVGDIAPEFTLVDTEKNKVSLSDQKGNKVLLLFFPMAFTGVCTTELCSVRDDIGKYENVNAKIFGISVDSPFTLGKFKEDQKLNFPLLSDFNKDVSEKYGCIYDAFIGWMKGVSKRAAFVIDEKGLIQYAEVLESAGDLPDFKAIKDVLEIRN